jgi:hypothetical protein
MKDKHTISPSLVDKIKTSKIIKKKEAIAS